MARGKKVTKKDEIVSDAVEQVDSVGEVAEASPVLCNEETEDVKSNVVTLSNIVSQSLKSGDSQLLETALGVSDEQVIEATLDRLPSAQVASLLNALLKRIHDKPSRLTHLLPWIRGTMIVHASFIRSCEEAKAALSSIKDLIDQRCRTREALLGLSGRLDLLLMQAMRKNNNLANPEQLASMVNTPMVVYEDDGEDDEEMGQGDDDVLMGNGDSGSDSESESEGDSGVNSEDDSE